MKNGLWGHALLLASKMDSRTHARVMTRYRIAGLQLLGTASWSSGRASAALRGTGSSSWQRKLPRPVPCSVLSCHIGERLSFSPRAPVTLSCVHC